MPEVVNQETEALRAALDVANRDTAAAQERANRAETQLRTETSGRFAAEKQTLDTSISTAETNAETLRQRQEDLFRNGEFKEATELNIHLANNAANLAQLRSRRQWLDTQEPQAGAGSDPLAQFNATEREWINKNPRYVSDPEFARRVNAAAQYAQNVRGYAKDSPEYFKAIEEDVYPERRQQPQPKPVPTLENTEEDPALAGEIGSDAPLEQQHTMTMPIATPTVDAPVMRLEDSKPEEPQTRAVGQGGPGVRAVAAPPSRRIVDASNRNLRPGQRIEPTQQEYEIALQLYNDIEPNAEDRSPEAAVRWYHAMYNHPSHRNTRRKSWVYGNDAGRAA